MDELRLLVSSGSPPTIIALVETWLDSTILPCELALPSYSLYRRDRDRHGGGVAMSMNPFQFAQSLLIHLQSC